MANRREMTYLSIDPGIAETGIAVVRVGFPIDSRNVGSALALNAKVPTATRARSIVRAVANFWASRVPDRSPDAIVVEIPSFASRKTIAPIINTSILVGAIASWGWRSGSPIYFVKASKWQAGQFREQERRAAIAALLVTRIDPSDPTVLSNNEVDAVTLARWFTSKTDEEKLEYLAHWPGGRLGG